MHIYSAQQQHDSIILKQIGNCSFKWQYVPPTPLLSLRGLDSNVLQQEVEAINQISKKHTGCSSNSGILPFLLIIAGLLSFLSFPILVINSGPSPGLFVCAPFVGIMLIIIGCIWMIYQSKTRFRKVREYIEVDLNNKWQQNGIRWTVSEGQKLRSYSSRRDSYSTHITYDIVVSFVTISEETNNHQIIMQTHQIPHIQNPKIHSAFPPVYQLEEGVNTATQDTYH